MNEIAWDSLLIRMSKGDEEAFTEIYRLTKQDAYRLIYFLTTNKNEVEDIMSEVYMALYKSIATYNPEQSFQSWFNGLIVRQVRNAKRKNWRFFRMFQKLQDYTYEQIEMVDDSLGKLETEQHVLNQVNQLSQKFKEVIVLRYYQACTFEEIAQILSVPIGTIKSRHHYALKQLRKQYELVEDGKEIKQYVY